jgi:hypothetical protein
VVYKEAVHITRQWHFTETCNFNRNVVFLGVGTLVVVMIHQKKNDFLISNVLIVEHKNYSVEDKCSISSLLTKWEICENTAYKT